MRRTGDHGPRFRVIVAGTLSELRDRVGQRDVLLLKGVFDTVQTRAALASIGGLEMVGIQEHELRLVLQEATRRLPEVLAVVSQTGAEIHEATLTQPSLESLFIQLTGKRLRE